MAAFLLDEADMAWHHRASMLRYRSLPIYGLTSHVGRDSTSRPYEVPWIVLNSATAKQQWSWRPTISLEQILQKIAQHAEAHPEWLEISSST